MDKPNNTKNQQLNNNTPAPAGKNNTHAAGKNTPAPAGHNTPAAGKNTPASYNTPGQRKEEKVLLEGANWRDLRFYQKTEVLYQLTYVFCDRFLPKHGDRTVDQMIQAARSGKQNIIEGSEDGKTSTEMELKLLNVARSSIHELREDFRDFLLSRHLPLWDRHHPRYHGMHAFTKANNTLDAFEPFFTRWTEEEMANIGYTLCCQVDVMMNGYLHTLEERFKTEGGIRERMHRVRTGYRAQQDQKMREMEETIRIQQQRIIALEAELARLKQERGL